MPDTQADTPDTLLQAATLRIDRIDAEWLLLHVLGRGREWLFAHRDDRLRAADVQAFDALVARRSSGEPVAYLTGKRGFWSLELDVDEAVLIPRWDTELLVELALARIPDEVAVKVADLGTGSGAIALAIAHERPHAHVVAVDASQSALRVAQGNADALGIANTSFRLGDWFAPLAGESFDLIASNPPYIAQDDPHLREGDLRFEPAMALASGADGLDAIRHIASTAPAHLRPGGWLLLEHGREQGAAVRGLLEASGFAEVSTERDLEDRDRVTLGRIA